MDEPLNPRKDSSFVGAWPRPTEGFEVADVAGEPWLLVRGGVKREPMAPGQRLVRELKQLASAMTDANVVAFADRFGSLEPWRAARSSKAGHKERIQAQMHPRLGEPLQVWRDEVPVFAELAEVVRALRTLEEAERSIAAARHAATNQPAERRRLDRLVEGRHSADERLTSWFPQLGDSTRPTFGYRPSPDRMRVVLEPGDATYERIRGRPERRVRRIAAYAASALITEKLRGGVSPVVTLGRGRGLRLAPTSLLGAAYLALASALVARSPLDRMCESCLRWFTPYRSDARFCGTACRSKAHYDGRKQHGVSARITNDVPGPS